MAIGDKKEKLLVKQYGVSKYRTHVNRVLVKKHRPRKFGRFNRMSTYKSWYQDFRRSQRGKRIGFKKMPASLRSKYGKLGYRAKMGKYKGRSHTSVYMNAYRRGIIGPRFAYRKNVRKSFR